MRLLVQPDDGIMPLLKGINRAKESIEIVVFRFDQREIEAALGKAVGRGVQVRALIAHTNRAGEQNLRRLELRLLAAGVTVARTGDDLLRYHGKLMVIDNRDLYLLAFNLTHADVERSRSFGLITRSRDLVHEALNLIEADTMRRPFEPQVDRFVVSPISARKRLGEFIQGARRELLIYDPKISDLAMIKLLDERARAGVRIRIIGKLTVRLEGVECRKLHMRLHTRTMVRDHISVFMGSQSLRALELDARREVGVILRHARIATTIREIFDADWKKSEAQDAQGAAEEDAPTSVAIARKVAKAVAREMPPVAPLLDGVVRKVAGDETVVELNEEEVEEIVKGAVKAAVKEVVKNVVEEVVESRHWR